MTFVVLIYIVLQSKNSVIGLCIKILAALQDPEVWNILDGNINSLINISETVDNFAKCLRSIYTLRVHVQCITARSDVYIFTFGPPGGPNRLTPSR